MMDGSNWACDEWKEGGGGFWRENGKVCCFYVCPAMNVSRAEKYARPQLSVHEFYIHNQLLITTTASPMTFPHLTHVH